LTAVVWKDKQHVHVYTNMHIPSAEGNVCDEHGRAQKPVIVADYSQCRATPTGCQVANI